MHKMKKTVLRLASKLKVLFACLFPCNFNPFWFSSTTTDCIDLRLVFLLFCQILVQWFWPYSDLLTIFVVNCNGIDSDLIMVVDMNVGWVVGDMLMKGLMVDMADDRMVLQVTSQLF